MTADPVDQKTFDTVAQFSHFGWGALVVFAPRALFAGHAYLYAAGLWVLYSAVKEFLWDAAHETPAVRGSSLKDFLFAVGGSAAALLALLIAR